MRLTQVLNLPPVFRFWKEFGAGKRGRMPHFKYWRNTWRNEISRKVPADHRLTLDKLPPGSRLLNGEDFLEGHIDDLPDDMIKRRETHIVYDHPWPYNVKLDPIKGQEPAHCYSIGTRFFVPKDDCQVLTNTILEPDQLEARPPFEPSSEHLDFVYRHHEWATRGDSVLVRQPKKREWPKINLKPRAKFGISKERQEVNVMNSILNYSQALLARYYKEGNDTDRLDNILAIRSLAFPHCIAPFERESRKVVLDLFVDSMSLSSRPMPLMESNPLDTCNKELVNIHPRSWRSILEKSKIYTPEWSFTLPRDVHLHTIQLASRIKRDHRNEDEMLARSIVHAFGLASQVARLRSYKENRRDETASAGTCVLFDPLGVKEANDKDLLEQPIVLQTISYDKPMGNFHFMRYQLNTLKFDDSNPKRVKNQAWHSGPISDLAQVLRFYLDFHHVTDESVAMRSARLQSQ